MVNAKAWEALPPAYKVMVVAVIMFPSFMTSNPEVQKKIDINSIQIDMPKREGSNSGYLGGENTPDPNNMFGGQKK